MIVRAGYVLLVSASIWFLESLYEMFALTALEGPQMLFFSLAHSAGVVLIVVLLSVLAYVLLLAYSIVLFTLSLRGRLASIRSHVRRFTVVAVAQLIHISLLATYDYWSYALFS